MPKRCGWVKMSNPLYVAYHDEEWGRPLHDDQALFLSCSVWRPIRLDYLGKRSSINGRLSENLFMVYHLQRVAEMTDEELESLLDNPAIIRNRAKIFATRANAQAFLQVQAEFGSFDAYLWSFVEGKPSTMMSRITGWLLRRQLFPRSLLKISKSVVSSLRVPLRSYPTYKQQAWSMITRMIVNGRKIHKRKMIFRVIPNLIRN